MSSRLLSGNEAVVEGALAAGLGFYAGYPITPASEIMEAFVKKPIEFLQAEDEIAAINMCLGASLAGKKALTATSGPGFSLMQEAIGYAYKLGVPLVVVDSQRVGPSTGMPTLGAQGDLLQTRHGSHGDYQSLVFYPNSVGECFRYTIEAINAAEELQTPVILLLDGFLSHLYETVDLKKINYKLTKRTLLPLGKGKRHFTGLTSKNNLPQTTKPEIYREWFNHRKRRFLAGAKKYAFYEYSENKRADTLLVAFGITSRVISPLKKKCGFFRPIRLFPIIEKLKPIAQKYKKIVVVEMNDGQYRHELEAFLKREVRSVNPLGGRISLTETKDELAKIH
jgi:2-oxoglutarate ferredoxin oxidoreductase subunit alpha